MSERETILRSALLLVLDQVDYTTGACFQRLAPSKELMVSTLAHEFAHALEELYGLEFSEDRVSGIVDSYYQQADASLSVPRDTREDTEGSPQGYANMNSNRIGEPT